MKPDEAFEMARNTYGLLEKDDYRFDGAVQILTHDGCSLLYTNAFTEKNEDWWMVFTKNFGFIVLHSDNLLNREIISYMRM